MQKWLRDLLILFLAFGVALAGLFAYTQVWPPAVIVESGSMMHADSEVWYGRFGTIDPGDLVLVKAAATKDDISTLVEGGRDRYGLAGDVIVYHPANARGSTPIIHRAIAYVEVVEGGYDVRWADDAACPAAGRSLEREGRSWCHFEDAIAIPAIGLSDYEPAGDGFITKGDNAQTNRDIDQRSSISVDASGRNVPVPMEWVKGKARGELPWLGLLKLALAGKQNQANPPADWVKVGSAYAPKDLWVMLGVSLFLLVGGPMIYDAWVARRQRDR